MATISVATIISRAVELRYPLEAVLESAAPVAFEFVVNVDVSVPDDGTLALLGRIGGGWLSGLLGEYRSLRVLPSKWNWDNHDRGSEFAIQSNLAAERCRGDWILYLQADEILHEDDHDYLRWLADTLPQEYAGVEFDRLCFWRDLRTLRTDWTVPMVRMFRRGRGRVVGDSMSCVADGHVWPVERYGQTSVPALYHYSRIGEPETIAARIQANDAMHHPAESVRTGGTYDFGLRTFDSYAEGTNPKPVPPTVLVPFEGAHPAPALKWFGQVDMGQHSQ